MKLKETSMSRVSRHFRAMATCGATRLFLTPADLGGATLTRVAHPRTGHTISIMRAGDALLEIQKWSGGDKASWMLAGAERVLSEGVLFVATPIDPLFLLLPHLQGDARYFRPLSDCLSGSADEAALELTALSLPTIGKRLRAVCDVKDDYDEPMVRLNEAKMLAWLRRKTDAVRAHLASDAQIAKLAKERHHGAIESQFEGGNVPFGAGAASADADGPEQEWLEHAIALVAEYLAPALQTTLCNAMAVAEARVASLRGDAKKEKAPAEPALQPSESWANQGSSSAASGASTIRDDSNENDAPAAKKPKTAAVAKAAKLGAQPLKKGQTTMMGFFAKPK